MAKHLYRQGAKKRMLRQFEKKYGKRKGRHIYFAVVGKVKREREAKKKKKLLF